MAVISSSPHCTPKPTGNDEKDGASSFSWNLWGVVIAVSCASAQLCWIEICQADCVIPFWSKIQSPTGAGPPPPVVSVVPKLCLGTTKNQFTSRKRKDSYPSFVHLFSTASFRVLTRLAALMLNIP